MMSQAWFEMARERRSKFSGVAWIPLRWRQVCEHGTYGVCGFREEFLGIGSATVMKIKKDKAPRLGWDEIGANVGHSAWVQDGRYMASDVYEYPKGRLLGIPLVLEQDLAQDQSPVWHLHQDLVIALGLLREDDRWVCPSEGYMEVVRLKQDTRGEPLSIEIRSEFLLDYLCARKMALRISSYRSRKEIVGDASHISWNENPIVQKSEDEHWEGRTFEIYEGGVPVFQGADAHGAEHGRAQLVVVEGECWLNEWMESGRYSARIRGDKVHDPVSFIVDVTGKRGVKEQLVSSRDWLWFKPDAIPVLVDRRGGHLTWYTRDTGGVRCSPERGVHFGINELGLVNVFAKDIAELPEWQQRIWVGFNVTPDGGVSMELFASQMMCQPAHTIAPEERFAGALHLLDDRFQMATGFPLFRAHAERINILVGIHRFRATDRNGLLRLAKEIARVTADSIDIARLHKLVGPPNKDKSRSLKLLQEVLSKSVGPEEAYLLMTPLFAAYELRLADAHLPGTELGEALKKAGVDTSTPHVKQGTQLIENCADALERICGVFGDGLREPLHH